MNQYNLKKIASKMIIMTLLSSLLTDFNAMVWFVRWIISSVGRESLTSSLQLLHAASLVGQN